MPIAPELITPELEAPTNGTYQELMEGHDWELHLPPSPEGPHLLRTAYYCPECKASVHLLLSPEGETILAAGFTYPAQTYPPGRLHQVQTYPARLYPARPSRLFLLEEDRMEPKTQGECRRALKKLKPRPGPTWCVPLGQDGQPQWNEKHQPLEPSLAPAFQDIIQGHRWKQQTESAQTKSAQEGEYLHQCSLCHARMHVQTGRSGRISRAKVRLPARRECYYRRDRNSIAPATGDGFYAQEPLRFTQEQLAEVTAPAATGPK